jgi:hypothetical protein
MMRAGVAALENTVEEADDWIWMIDHSNQIGTEKVLVVLGVLASKMPEPGVPLRHEDMQVLLVQPGESWNTEDVRKALDQLAERTGAPMEIVTDGASELRDGAAMLKTRRPDLLVIPDLKHHAANIMKKMIGKSPEFVEFVGQAGSTRSEIQQTELGHLTPPTVRPKSRFMNLAGIINWAEMVLWQLDHPESRARVGIDPVRFENKLGWVAKYRDQIAMWNNCQAVVSTTLTFINGEGLSIGASKALDAELTPLKKCAASQSMASQLVDFVGQAEKQLKPGQRLSMSTEIVESAFGQFKQLEGQHSKGGLTSLLAAFAATTKKWTGEEIREHFSRVSVKQTQSWVKANLKQTLASKRKIAFDEAKNRRMHAKA